MPASELLPLQGYQESRNRHDAGWAATQDVEDRNCRNTERNEQLAYLQSNDEPYQRSSLYQESSNGAARESMASNIDGRFLDTRPDQQIFRHDSNDPSVEMLQQPPVMYVQAEHASYQQEGPRNCYVESQRSSEVAAYGGEVERNTG